jgi:hypothetical protein
MRIHRYAVSAAVEEQILDMPLNSQMLSVAPVTGWRPDTVDPTTTFEFTPQSS